MSDTPAPAVGTIGWVDLTVDDADGVPDFHAAVTGRTPEPLSMGEYSDDVMAAPGSGTPVAGVCARFAVIRDPASATCALHQSARATPATLATPAA